MQVFLLSYLILSLLDAFSHQPGYTWEPRENISLPLDTSFQFTFLSIILLAWMASI